MPFYNQMNTQSLHIIKPDESFTKKKNSSSLLSEYKWNTNAIETWNWAPSHQLTQFKIKLSRNHQNNRTRGDNALKITEKRQKKIKKKGKAPGGDSVRRENDEVLSFRWHHIALASPADPLPQRRSSTGNLPFSPFLFSHRISTCRGEFNIEPREYGEIQRRRMYRDHIGLSVNGEVWSTFWKCAFFLISSVFILWSNKFNLKGIYLHQNFE